MLLPLFTVVGMDHCEEDWYASDSNLCGTTRGNRKKMQVAHRPHLEGRAVPRPLEERHGQSMAWAWQAKCESDTAALCKSNGKDTF